ncbi:hypothetical protein A2W24_04320 [Microgenomates group bacterium RBG_16_45_19]|nr:MAG: hypothetical protein A2W24_04320 [Microgenomates group bacterium RBG_16_45_19]
MSLSNQPNKPSQTTAINWPSAPIKLPYSSKRMSTRLMDELSDALKSIDSYGSVEIYVQNSMVTQITTRNIKKTNGHHYQTA